MDGAGCAGHVGRRGREELWWLVLEVCSAGGYRGNGAERADFTGLVNHPAAVGRFVSKIQRGRARERGGAIRRCASSGLSARVDDSGVRAIGGGMAGCETADDRKREDRYIRVRPMDSPRSGRRGEDPRRLQAVFISLRSTMMHPKAVSSFIVPAPRLR